MPPWVPRTASAIATSSRVTASVGLCSAEWGTLSLSLSLGRLPDALVSAPPSAR